MYMYIIYIYIHICVHISTCLADNQRKLYLGDAKGRVIAYGLSSGMLLTEFEAHTCDISCLAVWTGTNQLFSASWDGTVKVHSDECSRTIYIYIYTYAYIYIYKDVYLYMHIYV